MSDSQQAAASRPKLLSICTYEKGQAFLREAARLGCEVTLLTIDKLADADWPREALAALHTMPDGLAAHDVLPYITRLFRHNNFRRIVALDEFDQEAAALAREHLRLPGMGLTVARAFRDKLAMRDLAERAGVRVPAFFSVANHDELWWFLQRSSRGTGQGPWLLKPRASASAIGIRRIEHESELWPVLEQLGDEASHSLLESFVPGDVYHVDAVSWEGRILYAGAHKYGRPPMQTMHQGGVFSTRTLDATSEEARSLAEIHARTLEALGMVSGVTHSEFIRAHEDGQFYFLESAARVGGAYIAEVNEAASGINPWVEWARIEVALLRGQPYALPPLRHTFAGSVICLARQEQPNLGAYDAPEVLHRLQKHHHAGLIVGAVSAARVQELVDAYSLRFLEDFCARMDAPDRPI
jgi:biotin carboxylase